MLNDINLTGESINTIKNTDTFLVATKENGLAVNSEKNKYMVMPRNQHAGQNHKIMWEINRLKEHNSLNILEQP